MSLFYIIYKFIYIIYRERLVLPRDFIETFQQIRTHVLLTNLGDVVFGI